MISARQAMKQTLLAQAHLRKLEKEKQAKEVQKKIDTELLFIEKRIEEAIRKGETSIAYDFINCEADIKTAVEGILTGSNYKYKFYTMENDSCSKISWDGAK